MTDLPNKALLRPDEVADYYGVKPKTVRGWIATGKLEAVKVAGNLLRVRRESLPQLEKSTLE